MSAIRIFSDGRHLPKLFLFGLARYPLNFFWGSSIPRPTLAVGTVATYSASRCKGIIRCKTDFEVANRLNIFFRSILTDISDRRVNSNLTSNHNNRDDRLMIICRSFNDRWIRWLSYPIIYFNVPNLNFAN